METIAFKSDSEPGPQTGNEEELFCDYLAARLEQALDALNHARDALTGQPHDLARAAQVMRRVHELRDLKKQLELQRKRVDVAREAAGLEPLMREAETRGTAEFRAVQSEQAAKIMAALSAQPRTCPICQTPFLSGVEHCGCAQSTSSEQQDNCASPDLPLV